MKSTLRNLLAAAILAGTAGAAFAQPATLGTPAKTPTLQNINPGDVVPVIPGGVGGVPSQYAPAGMVGAMANYQYVVPVTAFSITPSSQITLLFLNPAGTLATGTITFPATPSDGGNFCVYDTQTQTAVTMTANTGQSIAGIAVTAFVANTQYCWKYISKTTTWYRIL